MGILLAVLELFASDMQLSLPCTMSLPHLNDRAAGELRCRVDAHTTTAGNTRAARVVCEPLADVPAPLAAPMRDGWYIVEPGLGAWHLGYGRDRTRPMLPTFGWQQQEPMSESVLAMLRSEGPDFPDAPDHRTWSAWANDDYSVDHVTRPNRKSWCTTTQIEGGGGLDTRWEVCYANGKITGASVSIFDGWLADPRCKNRPHTHRVCNVASAGGWTLQMRCGDAPVVVFP